MKMVRGFRFLLSLMACLGVAAAQDYRAKLQGVVTDSSQAVVVGAKVILHNDQTGVEAVKTTNDNGHYGFDFVEPGSYTVTVEQTGFAKFTQRVVLVQVRGDVTVNATLSVGAVAETITVSEQAVALQFNTSTMELTIDRKMLDNLPIMQRNPFSLALLDPAVVNRYTSQRNPFFMWSSSTIDVGGNTSRQNDLLLDGAPIQIGPKGSYSPPMDAVQEFSVQQNSVDAEFGHSAGGVLSLGMKSGTNEYHGTAYYFGRNPALNALSNSVNRTPNRLRNNIWGGSLGNPILKNKLFTFTAYEGWRIDEPKSTQRTMPTALERTGDFSQSLNVFGTPRAIYDPWTTIFEPSTSRVTRTPFLNNRIPASRFDPSSARFLRDIWAPNNPGDNLAGTNNYKVNYGWPMRYWNFTNRIDWNISDKWKVYGRYSRVRTDLESQNYANTPAVSNDNGGIMNNRSIAGDTVYLLNESTVLNFRFGFTSLEDDYDARDRAVGEKGLAEFWPNNPWYKPYIGEMPAIYYPRLSAGGGSYGFGSYWYQHPRHYTFSGSLRKNAGRHSWKTGVEGRRHRSDGIFPNLMNFSFDPWITSESFLSPDVRRNGDGWASFLLGALDSRLTNNAQIVPFQRFAVNYWAGFLQDDIKLTQRITLNLGLRYEFEGGPTDDANQFSRFFDLSSPIPEMQATPPRMPADVTRYQNVPHQFNGAWVFTDSSHRAMFDANPHVFLPRAGVAVRISDKTAIRAGYARYLVPPLIISNTLERINMPYFSAVTNTAPVLEGIPQARLSDPFPASNPLILPVGKARGRYTNLGDSASWLNPRLRTAVNDRFNFSVQRQLPNQFHVDVTYFINFGHDLPYTWNYNQSDPQLSYTHKGELSRQIPNPFFQYLTPEIFPGPLRNQRTVTIGSLLRPYPQNSTLNQTNTDGRLNRYHALQARVQRSFSKGYSFLWAYNYNQERNTEFFNSDATYARQFTFQDSNNPRHRMSIAGSYDLPFGKGRPYLANVHPVLNAILGGWSTSSLMLFNSGPFLRFNQMITDGSSPRLENRTRDRWFDTGKFRRPEPFTPRTNPWQYSGVMGPRYWNLDTTVSKFFPIKERFKLEFKFEAYNLTNSFIPSNPNTDVNSTLFGRSTNQQNLGREMQYSLRLHF